MSEGPSEELRIELQGQFGYQCARIQPSQGLGVGSYGSVCRATLDELPCAAKLLHATFFGTRDPGAVNFTARFEQECQFLSNLRHPCVVQFLGLVHEPRTLRPILLMEVMDESLTKFLERITNSLPYHVQVNLTQDIALALAYLHSNRIIHRDLSSNNILLLAGRRAKVTDFGMSRMVDINPRITPLTQCPGTPAFMAPEALLSNPRYSDKLDVFSCGVLAIQIVTRRYPTPSESKREVEYLESPTGVIEVPVPERERRTNDINRIATTHPLLPIAFDCIKDKDRLRPSAAQLCDRLIALKGALEYEESIRNNETVARVELEEKEREIESLNEQLEQKEVELQEADQQLAEKEDSIRAKEEEISTNEEQLKEKDQQIETMTREKERKFDMDKWKLERAEHDVCILQELVLKLQRDLLEKNKKLEQQVTMEHSTQEISGVYFDERASAPITMIRGGAVVDGNTAYFSTCRRHVAAYYIEEDRWARLPDCTNQWFGLAVINNFLTAVGGEKISGEPTNTLLSLCEERWFEFFPPMPTARLEPAVITSTHHNYVIVAGGREYYNRRWLYNVELLDCAILQWVKVCNLSPTCYPQDIAATLCADRIYCFNSNRNVYTCTLESLLASSQMSAGMDSVWKSIARVPVENSTPVSVRGRLIAVGGKETDVIHEYDAVNDSWKSVGHMTTPRDFTLAISLSEDKFLVVGGWDRSGNDRKLVCTVELGIV